MRTEHTVVTSPADYRAGMYALGQIARSIWPGGDVPSDLLETLLSRPATGLREMISRPEADQVGDEEATALVDALPEPFDDPDGDLPRSEHGPFWLGFYHYRTAMELARRFGPAELEQAGELLFGDGWRASLVRLIGATAADRLDAWTTGEQPIPAYVWAAVAGLFRERLFPERDQSISGAGAE